MLWIFLAILALAVFFGVWAFVRKRSFAHLSSEQREADFAGFGGLLWQFAIIFGLFALGLGIGAIAIYLRGTPI
ncbi:MAG: hypothetical protein ACD_17C00508G0005 [uncultured bacterium]|nr:MAG: hypothetical protein ACD_17C00508G0005 [uncultured bacterium]